MTIEVYKVFALVFAEELSQLAIASRSFDLLDLLADALGIVAFVGAGRLAAHRSAERSVDPAIAPARER